MHHDHHHMPMSLSDYSWYELYPPAVYIFAVVLAVLYYQWIARGDSKVIIASRWQQISMISAIILMVIIKGTPVQVLGHHYLFSVHMHRWLFYT